MGFSDAFKKLVGIEEIDDDFTEDEVNSMKDEIRREEKKSVSGFAPRGAEPAKAVPVEKRVSIAGTNAFKLVVIEPKSFDECPKLVDSLKGRRPVIINLEKIETETAKKFLTSSAVLHMPLTETSRRLQTIYSFLHRRALI